MKPNNITEILKQGYKLHTFRSGGGLRVIRLDKSGAKSFYGESYNFGEALRILNDDIKAGGRLYKDVYGSIESHYLTGASAKQNDKIDQLICAGNCLDAVFENDSIKVIISEWKHRDLPKKISDQIYALKRDKIKWKYKNEDTIYISEGKMFSGGLGISTGVENGSIDMHYTVQHIAKGETFEEGLVALEEAINTYTEVASEWEEVL